MLELVYKLDLKSNAEKREGSNPSRTTKFVTLKEIHQ